MDSIRAPEMLRRTFVGIVAGGLLPRPLAVAAQQGRVPRIGILRSGSPPDPYVEAFRQGLRELQSRRRFCNARIW